jgi:hypothetical protein
LFTFRNQYYQACPIGTTGVTTGVAGTPVTGVELRTTAVVIGVAAAMKIGVVIGLVVAIDVAVASKTGLAAGIIGGVTVFYSAGVIAAYDPFPQENFRPP